VGSRIEGIVMEAVEQSQLETAPQLQRRPADCSIPLTGSQRSIWNYLHESGKRTTRDVANAVRICGPLRVDLLQECLATIVSRHESLRTRIVTLDGVPTLHIDEPGDRYFDVVDLSAVPPTQSELVARRLAEEMSAEPVDWAAGPLFKTMLIKLSAHKHIFVAAADHVISDAASAGIVNSELWYLYRRRSQSLPAELPSLFLQFADYAVWQEQAYSLWRSKNKMYWQGRLAGAQPARLPVDCGSEDEGGFTNATANIPFGKRLSVALREVARRERTPLSLLALTVYACVMSRWCAKQDLVLTMVSHGRHGHRELTNMIGCFANCLHLRLEIGGKQTFLDLLQQVRLECEAAFNHYHFGRTWEFMRDFPTDVRFNWVNLPRAPLCQQAEAEDVFQLQPFPLGMTWSGKLWPFMADTPAGICTTVAYRPDLYLPRTIEQFGVNLRLCAQALIQDPHAGVATVSTEQ
jgi:hypothetical protein